MPRKSAAKELLRLRVSKEVAKTLRVRALREGRTVSAEGERALRLVLLPVAP